MISYKDVADTHVDVEVWKTFFHQNFHEKGLQGVNGYVQATLDLLHALGYTVIRKETANENKR